MVEWNLLDWCRCAHEGVYVTTSCSTLADLAMLSVYFSKKVINDPYAAVVTQEEVLFTLKYKTFRGSLEIYLNILRDN